jgi:lipopolysaccharide/colanic/teichoic acid biosynthesis glycosyltransferase
MLTAMLRLKGADGSQVRGEKSFTLGMLTAEMFQRVLSLERKRSERSGRPFVLLLLDSGTLLKQCQNAVTLPKLLNAVSRSTRDTDITGWYKDGSTIGVIFTELGDSERKEVVRTLSGKVMNALYDLLSVEEINELRLSFHIFPEDWDNIGSDGPAGATLQLALALGTREHKFARGVKRAMDIAGSLCAIICLSPLLLAIAIAIKWTSAGPALFRQVRVGRYGKHFTFLKFRSMYADNDLTFHREYVEQFITGKLAAVETVEKKTVYKQAGDPRVTPIGRFLRRTSLDELPQFFNVLRGDMSLVGPRPPIPYELEHYARWHRQRLAGMNTGITGLWQVNGRSRVTFDNMVRLDIQYARSWSLWLDVKILLKTPLAILRGEGAC